jgi:hypothetical protein
MAQDFKAAFGLGDTDRAYHAVDAHGVTIAAIQALYEMSLEQGRRIERLERDNDQLQRELNAVSRDGDACERAAHRSSSIGCLLSRQRQW